ncbi:MAG TPA: glycosyltransferase [Kiritimatiellia bacterium]|nr:glycosyltransferase [Kiritimatiellia bacterium]HRZ10834.1 glycosyltransferase [Kiritimatiellia bacterium]HSA18893.1 glycosyltransferase [Kiritimatiellia bacterium]
MTAPGTAAPFVSVVVLTRNRARLLAQCLDSLLRQDYPADRMELVVVDDGSTDGTAEYLQTMAARDARVRRAGGEHRGIPAARNAGIRAARGEFIAIVADDYLLAPDYVRTFVSFFRERPDASVVRFRIVPARDNLSSRLSHFAYEISLRKRLDPDPGPAPRGLRERLRFYVRPPPLPPPAITADHRLEAAGAAAYRREVFERVGLFDESLGRAEDSDMGRRLRDRGAAIYFHPFHTVAHQYGPWREEMLAKSFRAGIYHRRLAQRGVAGAEAGGAGHVIRRAIQMKGLLAAWLYLPSVLAAELARRAGMGYGRMLDRKK